MCACEQRLWGPRILPTHQPWPVEGGELLRGGLILQGLGSTASWVWCLEERFLGPVGIGGWEKEEVSRN